MDIEKLAEPTEAKKILDLADRGMESKILVLHQHTTLLSGQLLEFDELHVIEAAAHGADAVLLIVAILSTKELRHLRECAERLGLAALVEVHSNDELKQAADSGATIIGVNNRDLHTFQVTLDTSLKLAGKMPENAIAVSESGIHSHADVERLQAAGYRAFLVGEHLMRSPDPAAALRALRGNP